MLACSLHLNKCLDNLNAARSSAQSRDSTGASVPEAKITVTETSTNQVTTLTSITLGEFVAPSLAAGTYSVKVEASGFRPSLVSGLTLDAASTARADVVLEVGSTQQVVGSASERGAA